MVRSTRFKIVTVVVCVSCLVLVGCAPRRTAEPAVPPARPAPAYRSAPFATDVPPPVWGHRDHRLKGSFRPVGREGDTVLLVKAVIEPDAGRNELYLLDLRSGKEREIRHGAVERGQSILGYAIGKGWVAWEEVDSYDLDSDPRTVVWRLYAAPVDAVRLTCGKVRLVDEGTASARSRPLFGFDRATLYVATTLRIGSDGDGRVGTTKIAAHDLASGARRDLVRAPTPFTGFAVSEGRLVLTRRRAERGDNDASRVEVYDTAGRRVLTFDPPPTGIVSHSPAVHEGTIAWAELMPGEWSTNVYLRSTDGSLTAVSRAGGDACIAGDWAFAEASENTTESRRSFAPGAQVFGVRLGTTQRFLLVGGLIARGEMWQIAAPAVYRDDRLVVYRDGTDFEGDGYTVVRVYDLPPSSGSRGGLSLSAEGR